jgi:hypothetical protein
MTSPEEIREPLHETLLVWKEVGELLRNILSVCSTLGTPTPRADPDDDDPRR